MINIDRLIKQPRALSALTGLKYSELIELLDSFKSALKRTIDKKAKDAKRQRKPGGGQKPHLQEPLELLVFILVYWRVYPTQDLQGVLFNLCQWGSMQVGTQINTDFGGRT